MNDLKILVVDDEARMRKIVKDFLVAKDYIVIDKRNLSVFDRQHS